LYGLLPSYDDEPAFELFDVITPADLSFQQKITGLGGSCKVSRFFAFAVNPTSTSL
jgi:hypothetical protein